VGQTIGFCRLSGCRGESGTDDRFLSSVGLPRFAQAWQATRGDGLSHEGHEIFAAIEEIEQV
jgi:hypothetical protein